MDICICIYSFFTLNIRLRHFPNQPFTNGKHAVVYKSKETSETETVRQSLAVVLTTQSVSRLFKHISRRLFFLKITCNLSSKSLCCGEKLTVKRPGPSTTTSSLAPPPRSLLLSLVRRPVWGDLPPPAVLENDIS